VRDGLADLYVSAGRFDDAEALFEQRHEEDQGDVAVALSASRAFLAAGSISHAVRWLGIGAARAAMLGREELADRLRTKQARVRERLS
jgi:pentatricopeptide repeat protein